MTEVIGLLIVIATVGTVLAYLDSPLSNRSRFKGRVYDPKYPLARPSGAVGVTGRECPLCGVVTFGYSPRCGKCGRLNVRGPAAPIESTRRLTLVERGE